MPPAALHPYRSKTTAGLLALFLGGFGVHKFYLRRPGQGILYLLFCWTYIPSLIGIVEGIIYLAQNQADFDRTFNPAHVAMGGHLTPNTSGSKTAVTAVAIIVGVVMATVVLAATVFVLVSDIGSEAAQSTNSSDVVGAANPIVTGDPEPQQGDAFATRPGYEYDIIHEDMYLHFDFCTPANRGWTTTTYHFEASVTEGPNMDVILMTNSNFYNFQQGQSYYHLVDGTREDVRSYSKDLTFADDGSCYTLVYDNSDIGTAFPPVDGVDNPVHLEHRES